MDVIKGYIADFEKGLYEESVIEESLVHDLKAEWESLGLSSKESYWMPLMRRILHVIPKHRGNKEEEQLVAYATNCIDIINDDVTPINKPFFIGLLRLKIRKNRETEWLSSIALLKESLDGNPINSPVFEYHHNAVLLELYMKKTSEYLSEIKRVRLELERLGVLVNSIPVEILKL